MNSRNRQIFVTDFDGTLADDNSVVSKNTIESLKRLGDIGVIRVIATGRSLFSLKTVVTEDLPIDYLVFSSGIGIYDWQKQSLLKENSIGEADTKDVYRFLSENNYDFMVQLPVPDNHFFHHFSSNNLNSDFHSRISYYESHGVTPIEKCPNRASQFVIICHEEADHLTKITKQFPHLKIVKATSPIDRKSIWIEILPSNISKATGIEHIRSKYNVDINDVVCIGNDYYDLDMLKYSIPQNSYIVANAPQELLGMFIPVESNHQEGVANLIRNLYL